MIPDINVLVAASRTDHPHYQVARNWLESALAECATGGSLEILPMVAAGFLRLVTNKRIFSEPTPIKEALAFIDALLAVAGAEMLSTGREWPQLRRLCQARDLSGNAIPDASIAAAVQAVDGRLVTFDRDFMRLLGKSELLLLRG